MKTVAIAGHKGGLGKTTLAILIAQVAVEKGERVIMLDLDPQQSLYEWWSQRPDDDPLRVVDASYDQLDDAKKALASECDLLLIDTPPAHQDIISAAIEAADIVIVPCGPSPLDMKGVGETITLLERVKRPFFFVINRAINRTTIAAESLPLLAQHGKVAPKPVTMRVDYAQGMIGGNTPLDIGNERIREEIAALYEYLEKQVARL